MILIVVFADSVSADEVQVAQTRCSGGNRLIKRILFGTGKFASVKFYTLSKISCIFNIL